MPEATKVRPVVVMQILYLSQIASGLSGAELERCIQGTESDARGEEKHTRQHQQYDPKRSGHHATEVQNGDNGGDDHTDSAIDIGHIF
jgi:hypothetical protein